MKYLLELMTIAALGASLAVSCGKDGGNTVPPKPVVTEDMYSVTVHAETAEVLFSFTADAMSAFWTVTEPVGITTSFNGREVTKAFKNNGLYTGSLIAYGKAGQSDPVPFSFTIEGFVPPMTEEEQAAQEALSGKTFYVSAYGWWGEGWEWFEEPVDEYTADDRITFGADGTLTITQGETFHIYNDCVPGGEDYVVEGPGKWRIVTEDGAVKIQFVDGGFPLMLAGMGDNPTDLNYHYGLDAMWTVASIDGDGTVRVEIYQAPQEQWFAVFLSPVE